MHQSELKDTVISALEKTGKELTNNNSELKSKNNILWDKNVELRRDVIIVNDTNCTLSRNNSELRTELRELNEKLRLLNGNHDKLVKRNWELNEELRLLKQKYSRTNQPRQKGKFISKK